MVWKGVSLVAIWFRAMSPLTLSAIISVSLARCIDSSGAFFSLCRLVVGFHIGLGEFIFGALHSESSLQYDPYYCAWDVDSYCAHNLNFIFLYHSLSTSSVHRCLFCTREQSFSFALALSFRKAPSPPCLSSQSFFASHDLSVQCMMLLYKP